MIKYFFIIIIILMLLYYLYLSKFKHKFWYNQPVSRSILSKKDGIIIEPHNLKINNIDDSNYRWDTIKDVKEFKYFLLNNYSKTEFYSINYLNWILNFPSKYINKLSKIKDKNKLNICLYDKNKLIGTIIARPIKLYINKNIVEGFYVDFLCVHKLYRNQGIAPKLISKILKYWKKYKLDMNIFRIDNNPLPFDNIGCFNYYYYDIYKNNKINDIINKDIHIKKLDEKYLEEAYKYYNNYIKRYKLYQIFTLEEFKYYFLINKNIKTYISINDNKITGFFSFTVVKNIHPYKTDKKSKCIELSYFLSNNYNIIYNFIDIFKDYDFLIFLDIMNNNNLINILNASKSHKTYYQLYNYYTDINKNNIGLNI